jgi:2-haloacid dehalogenase
MQQGSKGVTRRNALSQAAKAFAAVSLSTDIVMARNAGIEAIAFDAFTIFDPRSPLAVVEECFPGKGNEIFSTWRSRQFEYSWLRTLAGNYANFRQVSEEALIFACRAANVDLGPSARAKLMKSAFEFKVWHDAPDALAAMRDSGLRLAYLSNLPADILAELGEAAGISEFFEHRLSTDRVRAFKPDPRAYQMAELAFRVPRDRILFVAFGGWDAAGARSFGFRTIWVNRLDSIEEELGVKPNAMGRDLDEVARYAKASR